MLEHIHTFFVSFVGVELPSVVFILLSLALTYFIFRALFRLFNVNCRILDYAMYLSMTVIALQSLGGITWSLSF